MKFVRKTYKVIVWNTEMKFGSTKKWFNYHWTDATNYKKKNWKQISQKSLFDGHDVSTDKPPALSSCNNNKNISI